MLLALIKVCCDALTPRARKAQGRRHCLTFSLNGIRFGIDTRTVVGIARFGILAEPRDKPRFIRGLFRHRGVMVPVFDIAGRYGPEPLRPGRRTCIVFVELGIGRWRRDVGIMVDEVFGVTGFDSNDLKPLPEEAHRMMKVEIIEGLVQMETDFLVMLDALRLLPDDEMAALHAYMRSL